MNGRHFYWSKRIYDEDKTPARQIGDRDLELLAEVKTRGDSRATHPCVHIAV